VEKFNKQKHGGDAMTILFFQLFFMVAVFRIAFGGDFNLLGSFLLAALGVWLFIKAMGRIGYLMDQKERRQKPPETPRPPA
jgi:uncharacterized membrane protein